MPRDADELVRLPAHRLAVLLCQGRLSAEELTRAFLGRIALREPEVQAWTFLDPDHALSQARQRDADRRAGRPQGPLHGLPVGIKDIVDTADMPTENGTVLMAGRRPGRDAAVVERLRAAGAVIMGKTVTTELAVYTPGKTRNPHDLGHTPGGSSSGSAAAVADHMVPLAIGSQTHGSTIRPASYCGVLGFKPSFGRISRSGVLVQSDLLDHVGLFANDLVDLAMLAEPLMGHDARDPATAPVARPDLRAVLEADWPLAPTFAFVRTPIWGRAEPDLVAAFAELVEALGGQVREAALPASFERAHHWHALIHESDIADSFGSLYERGAAGLSPTLRQMIERGREHRAHDYIEARRQVARLRRELEPVFEWADAILTPAATGTAPAGLGSTGSPHFCTIWTLLGLPALGLPLLEGGDGLPIGVQLVGPPGDDARLLRHARWLARRVASQSGEA
ncbi:MAG TPA: amidase [Geminicoccaceae bacterium]|nr:amidase [Geminicoccus sp.]HMU49839.1 amidase [Geminicoccaceae bacterium]